VGRSKSVLQTVACGKGSVTEQAPAVEPPWVRIPRGEIGQTEHLPGGNPRIQEYRAVVGAAPGENWCSAFAAWCLKQAGYSGPWTAAARSFLHVGDPLSEFRPGCIVVYWRVSPDDWRGHVHFGLKNGLMISGVGGNQNGAVSIKKYESDRALAFRWPS